MATAYIDQCCHDTLSNSDGMVDYRIYLSLHYKMNQLSSELLFLTSVHSSHNKTVFWFSGFIILFVVIEMTI